MHPCRFDDNWDAVATPASVSHITITDSIDDPRAGFHWSLLHPNYSAARPKLSFIGRGHHLIEDVGWWDRMYSSGLTRSWCTFRIVPKILRLVHTQHCIPGYPPLSLWDYRIEELVGNQTDRTEAHAVNTMMYNEVEVMVTDGTLRGRVAS